MDDALSTPDLPPPLPTNTPNYVSYGGEQVFQQPYSARDTQLYAFILPIESDKRALPQALLDRVLNRPSNGRLDCRLALPFALLSFQHFGALGALGPPDEHKGSFAYNEATLWLPVVDHNRPGLNFCYFVPYIFADNHFAIAAGREVYGYPKALGQIEMPLSPQDDLSFRLTTEAIPHFASGAIGQPATLIEVTPTIRPQSPQTPWQRWEHAAQHLVEHVAGDGVDAMMEFIAKEIFRPQVQMVFLKQFRDAANGARACYQAIVEGAGSITEFKGGLPLGEFDVLINPLDSHPVCGELGLEARLRAHGFFIEFSFDILAGREVSTI